MSLQRVSDSAACRSATRCAASRLRESFRFIPPAGLSSRRWTRAEISEIYAVRELLEAEALRLALPKLTDQQLNHAASVLDQIDAEPDIARWGALNCAFHLALSAACGNARLLGLIEAQHNAADRYVRILLSNLDYRARSQSEHRELLAACRKRDESQALMWLTMHLRDGSQTLVKSIK